MNKTIKLIQINKGNTELHERTVQINEMLMKHRPQVVIINELNLSSNDKITGNMFEDYKLETDNLDVVDKVSRTGILIHKNLQYKRRKDLETMGVSTVWIQLQHPGRKSLLIQGIYRQFQRLGREGSLKPASQYIRWNKIIEKWEKATDEGKEIITMGDMNLNYLRWEVQPAGSNSYDKLKKPMIDKFKENIIERGHNILSSVPTIINNNPETPNSCLDLMLTNRREKITSHMAGLPCFSDHTMQIMIRSSKPIQSNKKILRTRAFKNFNLQQYKINIVNHQSYIDAMYEKDSNTITKKIQEIIQDSLQEMSPVVTIQTAERKRTKLSERVRHMMVDRDMAYENYKKNKKT